MLHPTPFSMLLRTGFFLTLAVFMSILRPQPVFSEDAKAALPPDVLFAIGEKDFSPAEFRFLPEWADFAAKVPDKSQPVPFLKYVVGQNTAADWSPWHWGTAEAKAGFRRFTSEIEFDSPADQGKMYLVIGVCHGISGLGSEMRVETNGVESPVKRVPNPGMVQGPWQSFTVSGASVPFVVEIPAGAIRKGKNTLKIHVIRK